MLILLDLKGKRAAEKQNSEQKSTCVKSNGEKRANDATEFKV